MSKEIINKIYKTPRKIILLFLFSNKNFKKYLKKMLFQVIIYFFVFDIFFLKKYI